MTIFVHVVLSMVGHDGEKLEQAVESITVAGREKVDKKLQGAQLLLWLQHYIRQKEVL